MNCEKCGGECYDETTSKYWNGGKTKEGKNKPRWKCKDKDGCGWVKYEKVTEAQPGADRGAQSQPGRPTGPLAPVYAECMATAGRALAHYAKQYGVSFTGQDLVAATATMFIQASQSGRPITTPKEAPKPAPAKRSDALEPYLPDSPDEVM